MSTSAEAPKRTELRPADQKRPNGPVVSVLDLDQRFKVAAGTVRAVAQVSFDIGGRETLGLVGESGCGKSSTLKAMMRLTKPQGGKVILNGVDFLAVGRRELRQLRPKMQMIFQDPISSLNPRRTVGDIVSEPLAIQGVGRDERRDKVEAALHVVGLDAVDVWSRRPHEFSGGQCQRISIARAIVGDPEVLLCDEAVSALDVSVQAQILNLLEDLRDDRNLSMAFVSHDLSVVHHVADRIAVMYLGRIVELAPSAELYRRPTHPYTSALLAAIPEIDPAQDSRKGIAIRGEPPSPLNPPSGCGFHPRCPRAVDVCLTETPQLTPIGDGHLVACHRPLENGWESVTMSDRQPSSMSPPGTLSST